MFYYLSKFLQQFLWPLNIVLALLVLDWFFLRRQKKKQLSYLLLTAFSILFIFSLTPVSSFLREYLESTYPSHPYSTYPTADAIVVLGGSVAQKVAPRLEAEEVHGSRVLPAFRLFRAKRAPLLVASGGVVYRGDRGEERTEADDIAEILVDLGVPETQILREKKSRTTLENAKYAAEILRDRKIKHILLVTSALHMRRAVYLFHSYGFDVTPVPTSHEVTNAPYTWLDVFPSSGALDGSTRAIKEIVGYLISRLNYSKS